MLIRGMVDLQIVIVTFKREKMSERVLIDALKSVYLTIKVSLLQLNMYIT